MKKIILAVFILPLFLVSCGNDKATYTDTIANYVETAGGGKTKYDMDFEMKKIHEVRDITVGDSVKHIQAATLSSRKINISRLEDLIKVRQENYDKQVGLKYITSPTARELIMSERKKELDDSKAELEELKNAPLPIPDKYKERDMSEVIALGVKCTYAATIPIFKTRAEETLYFILSPDGKRCYHTIRELKLLTPEDVK